MTAAVRVTVAADDARWRLGLGQRGAVGRTVCRCRALPLHRSPSVARPCREVAGLAGAGRMRPQSSRPPSSRRCSSRRENQNRANGVPLPSDSALHITVGCADSPRGREKWTASRPPSSWRRSSPREVSSGRCAATSVCADRREVAGRGPRRGHRPLSSASRVQFGAKRYRSTHHRRLRRLCREVAGLVGAGRRRPQLVALAFIEALCGPPHRSFSASSA